MKNSLRALYDWVKRKSIDFYHTLEFNEATGMLGLGLFVGIASGYAGVVFTYLISFIQMVMFGASEGNGFLSAVSSLTWYYRLLIPAVGGLVIGPIIHFIVKEARATGVPEVLESIVTKNGSIRWRVGPLKMLVSSITIGSGGSAGREGPIVQIGSAIGSALGDFLDLPPTKVKTVVGCGAAGGIAGTFNAPLGGVIFSLEILLEDFHVSEFTSIIVSSVMATAVSQHYLGANPAFAVPNYSADPWELSLYALLGVLSGLLAVLLTRGFYDIETLFENKLNLPSYTHPALGGIFIGIISLWVPHVLGVGYYIIEIILLDKIGLFFLLTLLISKLVATSITLGSGGSGGAFGPSLFIGAAFGGIFAKSLNLLFPSLSINPGSYALIGMGSIVAGSIHAPLTAIVLLFEMTKDYKIILPLMLACMLSTVVNKAIQKNNMYSLKLVRRGIDILSGKETNILRKTSVKEAMRRDVKYLRESDGIKQLKNVFSESHHTHYPVLKDDSDEVIGVINYTRHWDILDKQQDSPLIICRDLAQTPAVTVSKNDNLLTALEKITDFHVEILPVVSEVDNKELIGILSRNDIINSYNQKLRKERNNDDLRSSRLT